MPSIGEFGRCDVLVNNAGMSPAYADLASVGEDLYDKVQAINTKGPFRLSALIGSSDGGGRWRFDHQRLVGQLHSVRPAADLPYAMAKAALNALTLGLAGVWAPKVRANLVLPSATETDLTRRWPDEVKARIAEGNPMKRMGQPEDVVGACVFLASKAASYVNGAQIPVDGGSYRCSVRMGVVRSGAVPEGESRESSAPTGQPPVR